jgi:ABC-2 type transport system ATP-binding protein
VKVREYIHSLARVKTVILTTHNMDEAERLADRVGIIDHGKLLVLDTPQALKGQLGGGDVLEVELIGDALDEGRLKAALQEQMGRREMQVGVDLQRHQVSVRGLNAISALAPVQEALQASGMGTGEVRLRQNSLEDVFIHLTGRSLRE